jgi:ATP/maltotriose-dependent transcriptional regulator MalT
MMCTNQNSARRAFLLNWKSSRVSSQTAVMKRKQKAKSLVVQNADESISSRRFSRGISLSASAKSSADICPTDYGRPCRLGAAIFSEPVWKEIAHSLKLSGQELQIVRGVFDDCTESAIANHLSISPHTVHTHCERLYHKLAVTDRVKLVLRITNEFLALTAAPDSVMLPICANQSAGRCPLRRA